MPPTENGAQKATWPRWAAIAVWEVLVPGAAATIAALHPLRLPPNFQTSDRPVAAAIVVGVVTSWLLRYWRGSLPGGKRLDADQPLGAPFWIVLGLAAASAWGVREYVVTPCRVLGDSMLPSVESGDDVAITRRAFRGGKEPARGDVILFEKGGDQELPYLLKRVVGLPGDRIRMRGGIPVINGWTVPSCEAGTYLHASPRGVLNGRLLVEFLEDRAYLIVYTPLTHVFEAEYEVKPGEVFVLGDDRNNSTDSRAFNDGRGGGVELGSIQGRVDRFLVGHHRDGTPDFSRFLESFGTRLRLEGVDTAALERGVERCLRSQPAGTHPPSGTVVHSGFRIPVSGRQRCVSRENSKKGSPS